MRVRPNRIESSAFVTAARVGRALLACLACAALAAAGACPAAAAPTPAMLALLDRTQAYFDRSDFAAVLDDPRYASNKTEAARLSVVCQILGYSELYAAAPTPGLRDHIGARGTFLVQHFDQVRSNTAFDGMLALALLRCYQVTGDTTCWNRGVKLVGQLEKLTAFQNTLNWGLMSAMGLAEYARQSGDDAARAKVLEIITSLKTYQHGNGSFPHYCPGSTDLHYSAFMALELMVIRRMMPNDEVDRLLSGIGGFVHGRVGVDGQTDYVDECPEHPACATYYYGQATGCRQDYDTRGWSNEMGYSAAIFDHFADPSGDAVMGFLASLETDGGFPDKWAYFVLPTDPNYPWSSADPSVIRTSIIFWSLATIVGAQAPAAPALRAVPRPAFRLAMAPAFDAAAAARVALTRWRWSTVDSLAIAGVAPPPASGARAGRLSVETCPCDQAPPPPPPPPPSPPKPPLTVGRAIPNPGRTPVHVALSLGVPARIEVTLFDVTGHRVRTLLDGIEPAGDRDLEWDMRADDGRLVGAGLYFMRVTTANDREWRKIVLL